MEKINLILHDKKKGEIVYDFYCFLAFSNYFSKSEEMFLLQYISR